MKPQPDPEPERGPLRDRRWLVEIHSVPNHGVRRELSATEAERADMSKLLDLTTCHALDAVCEVKPSARGRFRVHTKLVARITQACTITLEPLDATVSEAQTTEFWPADEIEPRSTDETIDAANLEIPSAITGNHIDLGQLLYELLAVSIDPYPRKAGAEFVWQDTGDDPATGPFAALKKLKDSNTKNGTG